MAKIVEHIDYSEAAMRERFAREQLRRVREERLRSRLLNFLDTALGLGYWWFRKFEYECHNPDGSVWTRQEVRHTLGGSRIPWGRYFEFYDDGAKACEGLVVASACSKVAKRRKHRYWLPDGTQVSQHEYMRFLFGPDIDGCHDPEWEK